MARLGINPARKRKSRYQPKDVTVAILTYIPHLAGYFRHRLEVLKLSLASLFANTNYPYDLLIFDNGSCREVVDYLITLHNHGQINYLYLCNENLGVEGALKVLSNTILGRYIAYANDDVLYYPGWLKSHMDILDTYPKVGMVSGSPAGFSSEDADQAFQEFVNQKVPGLEVSGRERVTKWEKDWAISTGRNVQDHLQKIANHPHEVVKYQGVRAVNSATHFQFVAPKDVIQSALPPRWGRNLMGGVVEMDHKVDEMGYLRLSTMDRVTRHIGNRIDEELVKEIKDLGIAMDIQAQERQSKTHWIVNIPGFGRLLRRLYNWLFDVLNE